MGYGIVVRLEWLGEGEYCGLHAYIEIGFSLGERFAEVKGDRGRDAISDAIGDAIGT